MLLNSTYNATTEFMKTMHKSQRKSIGQFFTALPTAQFMGSLVNCENESVRVLDAGAGTGILSAAILQHLFSKNKVKKIEVDLYENNESVLQILQANVDIWKTQAKINGKYLKINIINENYITHNTCNWNDINYCGRYDIIVSNPPYKKIAKKDIESSIMNQVVYGQPNLYFLFMAMSIKLLKDDGEFIFIIPRSWASGLYFTAFRRFFFDNMSVTNLHLFVSRDKVFGEENVLQETMIIKAAKTKCNPPEIVITSNNGTGDFPNVTSFMVPYNTCIKTDKNRFLFLPTSPADIDILNDVNKFTNNLESIGFKLKTGVTVDFRSRQWMRDKPAENTVPLFWAFHFNGCGVKFPQAQERNQYITTDNKALLMNNSNYLLMKRFTSKEEKRRLQPVIFLRKDFMNFQFISTENHLNYLSRLNGEMTEDEMYGLYVIFASTLWDKYYRILNGSTQVNATEINAMPIPCLDDIRYLGKRAKMHINLTTQICDSILEGLIYENRGSENNIERNRYAG